MNNFAHFYGDISVIAASVFISTSVFINFAMDNSIFASIIYICRY